MVTVPTWYTEVVIFLPFIPAVLPYRFFLKLKENYGYDPVLQENKNESGKKVLDIEQVQESKPLAEEEPPKLTKTDKENEEKCDSEPVQDLDFFCGKELEIIRKMEFEFYQSYQYAFNRLLNRRNCIRFYELLVKKWGGEKWPIPVQLRFEQLCEEYKPKFENPNPMVEVDQMEGHAFEEWCASLLRKNEFTNVEVTQGSRDQGVDVLAVKDGIRYAIQCKCYASDLGNKPVQEVNTGRAIYHCQIGVVMTNRYFTSGAKKAAEVTGVLL